MNPYQQNIDIVKGFFKRKITLLFAIFTILPIFSIVFLNLDSVYRFIDAFSNDSIKSAVGPNTNILGTLSSVYILLVFQVLLAVIFLLFFVKSDSEKSTLNAPIKMFRIVSIIEMIIVILISLAMVFVVMFASLYIMANYTLPLSATAVPIMFISIPAFLVLVFGQLKFAGNIKESVTSIYLKQGGAKLYGIANIIMAVICVYFTAVITIFGISEISTFAPLIGFFGLSVIKYIFGALLGLKYAKYIGEYSNSATTREKDDKPEDNTPEGIVCKKCGNPLNSDDYFCNHCGTPVEKQ